MGGVVPTNNSPTNGPGDGTSTNSRHIVARPPSVSSFTVDANASRCNARSEARLGAVVGRGGMGFVRAGFWIKMGWGFHRGPVFRFCDGYGLAGGRPCRYYVSGLLFFVLPRVLSSQYDRHSIIDTMCVRLFISRRGRARVGTWIVGRIRSALYHRGHMQSIRP